MTNFVDSDMILQKYLSQIQKYEPLSFEEEQALAHRWRDHGDELAAHKLMQSYLRLVVKVALGFKGYQLPLTEVIQEGNIGLMQAIARFEPERGFRLSTYAMWWIRASIQEYILNNWSMVRIGTTAAQKKLFFNLRRLRNQLREVSNGELNDDAADMIATELGVKKTEVMAMEQRLSRNDQSLNVSMNDESDSQWMDMLVEESPNQEEVYSEDQILNQRREALASALEQLDEREREIFTARQLQDDHKAPTLEILSQQFGISRERVRQLEKRALDKIKKHIHAAA